jgi:arylsulfatase A-like enzyme
MSLAGLAGGLFCLLFFAMFCPTSAIARKPPPNVVLIQVDDMARSLLRSRIRIHGHKVPAMPNLLGSVAGKGVELDRYYSSDPICGPSRASLLSGRAVHNHGMLINAGPFGYSVWSNGPAWTENLPVWLQRAGYRTAHIGKYMNGYGEDSETVVPPGWDRWVTPVREAGSGYYGITLNIDGAMQPVDSGWQDRDAANCRRVFFTQPHACFHSTDLYTSFALKEISEAGRSGKPFYLQLDYNAPHDDGRLDAGPTPPPRLKRLSRDVIPGYHLRDVPPTPNSPVFIRDQPRLNAASKDEIRHRWINEVLSVKGVDQGIGRIIALLRKQKQLGNTFVIFTSDNGMFHGEHRIAYGKYLPHEPASRQPFLVRGPGLPARKASQSLASNLDVAATVLAMTGTARTAVTDGRSLLGDLKHPRRVSKAPVLLEGFNGRDPSLPEEFLDGGGRKRPNQAVVLNYTGFVSGRWKYVRYSYGDHELYDLRRDPGERQNLWGWKRMAPVLDWADGVTDRLADCSGPTCRQPAGSPARP